MSGNKYILDPNRPLFLDDDDDVDDETFLKGARNPPSAAAISTNPFEDSYDPRLLLQQKRQEIENRTLVSTERSLGLLRDTEEVGVATAEELARQREQLENTSKRLDEINTTLRFSQKHLNGLKSVFGAMKNYISGQKDYTPRMTSSPSGSKISEATSVSTTPAGGATAAPMSPEERYNSHPTTRLRSDVVAPQQTTAQMNGASFNEKIDRNLLDMSQSLSRLKGLAIDLHQEIDTQNDLIDNITYKVEDVDLKVGKQNKDMNKILGKK